MSELNDEQRRAAIEMYLRASDWERSQFNSELAKGMWGAFTEEEGSELRRVLSPLYNIGYQLRRIDMGRVEGMIDATIEEYLQVLPDSLLSIMFQRITWPTDSQHPGATKNPILKKHDNR